MRTPPAEKMSTINDSMLLGLLEHTHLEKVMFGIIPYTVVQLQRVKSEHFVSLLDIGLIFICDYTLLNRFY